MKKVSKKGFTLVELLVVIGILGILMGALFPVISSAMLNANLSTMAMQGGKLVKGILQANIEREPSGLGEVWPTEQTGSENSNVDTDDISRKNATTTTQYFYDLFAMKDYGNQGWEPTVDGDLLSTLSGCGVPGISSGELKADNIAWSIAKNVYKEMPDTIPVLVTKNVDFNTLNGSMDSYNGEDSVLSLGGTGKDVPFGNKGFVLVRRSGASESIKKKYCRLNVIFKNQKFNLQRDKKVAFMDL